MLTLPRPDCRDAAVKRVTDFREAATEHQRSCLGVDSSHDAFAGATITPMRHVQAGSERVEFFCRGTSELYLRALKRRPRSYSVPAPHATSPTPSPRCRLVKPWVFAYFL